MKHTKSALLCGRSAQMYTLHCVVWRVTNGLHIPCCVQNVRPEGQKLLKTTPRREDVWLGVTSAGTRDLSLLTPSVPVWTRHAIPSAPRLRSLSRIEGHSHDATCFDIHSPYLTRQESLGRSDWGQPHRCCMPSTLVSYGTSISRSNGVLETLTVVQLANEFRGFQGARRSITVKIMWRRVVT
jgi:hypothetical protein